MIKVLGFSHFRTQGRLWRKVSCDWEQRQCKPLEQGELWSRAHTGTGQDPNPMSQMTQFLKYLFQWFIGQGRKPSWGKRVPVQWDRETGSLSPALHWIGWVAWDKSLSVSVPLSVKWEVAHPQGVLWGSPRRSGAWSFICFFICKWKNLAQSLGPFQL